MVFTLGDVIVFLVVAVALFTFRQLDRNNRSLDKIKRFADKVQSDLSKLVESKTDEVNNLTIELDVHLKTAKEILKRVHEIEGELTSRTKGVDEISKRVSEYDTALSSLISMTEKVDENLKRLHEESQFVDTVGKRVREAANQLNHIEKNIPTLSQEFNRQNEHQLKSASSDVVRTTEELVDSIAEETGKTQEMVKELSEYVAGLEARRDAMEEDTMGKVQGRFHEFVANADDSKEGLLKQFRNDLSQVLETEEEKGRELIDDIQRQHGELRGEIDKTEDVLAEKLEVFQDRITRIEDDYQKTLREVAERGRTLEDEVFIKLKDHIEARARNAENTLIGLINGSKERLETSRKELVHVFGETRSQLTVWKTELQKTMEDSSTDFHQKYQSFTAEVDARITSILDDAGSTQRRQQHELIEFMEKTSAEITQLENENQDKLSSIEALVQQKEHDFVNRIKVAEKTNKETADEIQKYVEEAVARFQENLNNRFSGIEANILEYEENVNYRFGRVDEIHSEIEVLEQNLKKNMDNAVGRARQALRSAMDSIASDRQDEKKNAELQLSEIRDSMGAIDSELTELKSNAYANVSEKLQVFEDDFFSDLKGKDEKMQERLYTWQQEIQSRIDHLAADQRRELEEMERAHTDELKARVSDLQRETYSQYERFDSQVLDFQTRLENRISSSESNVSRIEEQIQADVAGVRQATKVLIEKEMSDFSSRIKDQLRDKDHEVESNLRVLGERLEEGSRELMTMLETANSDVAVWQAKVLQEMKDAQALTRQDSDAFQATLEKQQETLAATTSEESKLLRSQLEDLGIKVADLEQELKIKSRESLDEFSRNTESFIMDFQKKSNEIQTVADETVRGFRMQIVETRERIESTQQKLQSKVDESYRSLSGNLDEIEKKQKNFINQTKIFERADSLKVSLQETVEDLKADIARLSEHRSELRNTEKEFSRIRRLGDDVSSKLSKFMSEKRRIDSMDEDFKRLIGISQSIDLKLEQVTASHDVIQEAQARIRMVEDTQSEVEQRYSRLEGRKQILEATTAGVDNSFQKLSQLEEEIHHVEEVLAPLPEQLESLQASIALLSDGKAKADLAVEQLEQLESVVQDVEERMNRMQTARDWLARTETRLSEISKQAEEQVKIMGTLLKSDEDRGKKGKGAPPRTSRDIVIRLAHQGWKVEQIMKATQLSRGEVELILELQPKG